LISSRSSFLPLHDPAQAVRHTARLWSSRRHSLTGYRRCR